MVMGKIANSGFKQNQKRLSQQRRCEVASSKKILAAGSLHSVLGGPAVHDHVGGFWVRATITHPLPGCL